MTSRAVSSTTGANFSPPDYQIRQSGGPFEKVSDFHEELYILGERRWCGGVFVGLLHRERDERVHRLDHKEENDGGSNEEGE